MNSNDRLAPWAAYTIVGLGSLVMLAPFYFMFVFATHSRTEIFSLPPPLLFGNDFLANLEILTERIPFWRNLGWSVYVADGEHRADAAVLLAGRLCLRPVRIPLQERLVRAWCWRTMLLPSFMNMIPTFMIMDALGWIDQPRALYLPGAASAFGIFLMRQFVTHVRPQGTDRSRPHGRVQRIRHLLHASCCPAQACAGHARSDHLHRVVEQLHRPADRHAIARDVHAATGTAQPAKPSRHRVGRADDRLRPSPRCP